MPVLHAIQDELGYIPPEAVPVIAETLNLTRAEVHGVITFYHDFRMEKPGRHIVRICQAESCQAMGSVALTASVRERLGIGFHQTTKDGGFTLEEAPAQIVRAMSKIGWYKVQPTRLYFIDNSQGFGHRAEILLPHD